MYPVKAEMMVQWLILFAAIFLRPWTCGSVDSYRIGIVGTCDVLEHALRDAGYPVSKVTYHDFTDNSVSTAKYSCLVLAQSQRFPYTARDCLLRYLHGGGDIITLGGYAFETPVYAYKEGWYSQDQLLKILAADSLTCRTAIDFADADIIRWSRDCDNPQNPSVLSQAEVDGIKCLKIDIRNFTQWDTFRGPFTSAAGHNALTLSMKGSDNLRQAVVEVREKDGSRWVTTACVSAQWQDVVLLQSAFQFLPDGSPAGRGKSGDSLSLENAACIQLGMSYDFAPHKNDDYRIWIQRIGTAAIKLPDGFGMPLFEKVLPIFSQEQYFRFNNAVRISVHPGQSFVDSRPDMVSSFKGISAVGYPYIDQSQYFGILEAIDESGRRVGFAGGVLVHYDGPYKDGRWLIFGVENETFYSSDFFTETVCKTLEKIRDRTLSGRLADAAAQARKKFMPRPKSSLRPVHRSSDGKHLVYADGKRFFMLGVNYIGSFDCKTSHAAENFVYEKWEADFQKAHEAGINCMRLWIEGLDGSRQKMDSILYLADRYGIYLLLMPAAHPKEDGRDLANLFSTLAQLVDGEPAVIGYDLMNEPYITTVGSVRIDGQKSDIVQHDPYSRYTEKGFYDKQWVDTMAQNRTGWPELSDWSQNQEAKSLLAAYDMLFQYSGRYISAKDYSSLFGIHGNLPIDPQYADFFKSVDKTFASWIQLHTKPIRKHDSSGLITVGYNTMLTVMPANKELDIVSHHLYQQPTSYADMQKATTAFDRLRLLWPDKPITLGEFGYSCGTKLPDGGMLDIYNAAVAEMSIYLYAYAGNFDGAMSWMLSDWPVAQMDNSAPWIGKSRQRYEAGFGMYAYDGTRTGRPKPVVAAMKCLREYLDISPSNHGRFQLVKADTQTGCGYIYENDNALFVGMKNFTNENIQWSASHTANLMLFWTTNKFTVLSTADAAVSIDKRFLEKILGEGEVRMEGAKKSFSADQNSYRIELFEGQKCLFTKKATLEKGKTITEQKK